MHKTTLVKVSCYKADIDTKIAPLIKEIWKAGISTLNSCQANPDKDWIWIQFDTVQDLMLFIYCTVKYDETFGSLYWRAVGNFGENEWRYDFLPFDGNLDEWLEGNEVKYEHVSVNKEVSPNFNASLRFPATDYNVVLARMKEYNRKKK